MQSKIKTWLKLSRLPFHTVGLAPVLAASFWASYTGFPVNWFLVFVASLGVITIMLSTYFAGEYFDQKEDHLSSKYWISEFAGGSKALAGSNINPKSVLKAANICAVISILIGIFIQFYFKTGFWTLPLGAIGLFSGYFYSVPPLRWVKRGIGELLISICYGFLPVFTIFYLLTGQFDYRLFYLASPMALSIFLVIFINEFPDNQADTEVNKKNLVVRFGLKKSRLIYIIFQAKYIFTIVMLMYLNVLPGKLLLFIPIGLSVLLATFLIFNFHKKPKTLEPVCALTIVQNLLSSLVIIAYTI
ncbi:MAG: prenyltransferase [Candidatus Kapabacteria bacterium]|nr:prenyltransferase [Candidatus Kapabacteria bacterium]